MCLFLHRFHNTAITGFIHEVIFHYNIRFLMSCKKWRTVVLPTDAPKPILPHNDVLCRDHVKANLSSKDVDHTMH